MSLKAILSGRVCLQDRYIPNYDELSRIIKMAQECGNKISMTQGVYDLIHPGHTRYLEKAKQCGDLLVVALDSDEYTKARKQRANERRPVVPFEERLELLVNLRSVDIVTIRDLESHRNDPYTVIKAVRPDVLVMSRSTTDVTEADHKALEEFCGRVEVLEPQAVVSTTARLRDLMVDGATDLVDHVTDAIQAYFDRAGREVFLGKNTGKKAA